MDLEPMMTAVQPIPAHAIAAFGALAIAIVQFSMPKGTGVHRVLGWGFVILMGFVAISALWIHELRLVGPFSPIHLLIPVTLIGLWSSIRAVRRRDIAGHRRGMIQIVVLALLVTGAFTLLPGRVMHDVFFDAPGSEATSQ